MILSGMDLRRALEQLGMACPSEYQRENNSILNQRHDELQELKQHLLVPGPPDDGAPHTLSWLQERFGLFCMREGLREGIAYCSDTVGRGWFALPCNPRNLPPTMHAQPSKDRLLSAPELAWFLLLHRLDPGVLYASNNAFLTSSFCDAKRLVLIDTDDGVVLETADRVEGPAYAAYGRVLLPEASPAT